MHVRTHWNIDLILFQNNIFNSFICNFHLWNFQICICILFFNNLRFHFWTIWIFWEVWCRRWEPWHLYLFLVNIWSCTSDVYFFRNCMYHFWNNLHFVRGRWKSWDPSHSLRCHGHRRGTSSLCSLWCQFLRDFKSSMFSYLKF